MFVFPTSLSLYIYIYMARVLPNWGFDILFV
jgi:hypothetical protein